MTDESEIQERFRWNLYRWLRITEKLFSFVGCISGIIMRI